MPCGRDPSACKEEAEKEETEEERDEERNACWLESGEDERRERRADLRGKILRFSSGAEAVDDEEEEEEERERAVVCLLVVSGGEEGREQEEEEGRRRHGPSGDGGEREEEEAFATADEERPIFFLARRGRVFSVGVPTEEEEEGEGEEEEENSAGFSVSLVGEKREEASGPPHVRGAALLSSLCLSSALSPGEAPSLKGVERRNC